LPMFDSRELQRWGIDEKVLPPGSIVRFREATFWQQYRWRVVAVAIALLLQTTLIVSLLAQRRRTRRGSAALRESEERYRSLVLATSAFVWIADKDGKFSRPQSSWQAYTGQSFEEHLRKQLDRGCPSRRSCPRDRSLAPGSRCAIIV